MYFEGVGEGVSAAKIFKREFEAQLEYPGGGGFNSKHLWGKGKYG